MWPVSFRTNLNTSVLPLITNNVVPSEGFKGWDFEYNRFTRIFEAQDNVLGFIVVFEDVYPSINSRNNSWS